MTCASAACSAATRSANNQWNNQWQQFGSRISVMFLCVYFVRVLLCWIRRIILALAIYCSCLSRSHVLQAVALQTKDISVQFWLTLSSISKAHHPVESSPILQFLPVFHLRFISFQMAFRHLCAIASWHFIDSLHSSSGLWQTKSASVFGRQNMRACRPSIRHQRASRKLVQCTVFWMTCQKCIDA